MAASRRRRGGGGHPDANQGPLVKLARRLGATVQITSQIGGWVDATVGFRGVNLLWEIKAEGFQAKVAKGRKLTKTEQQQADLRATWTGRIDVIETADDVIRALLQADLNKPSDYYEVPNDYLAAIVKVVRSNPDLTVAGQAAAHFSS
jgi:hypothetical protein